MDSILLHFCDNPVWNQMNTKADEPLVINLKQNQYPFWVPSLNMFSIPLACKE